jgi:LysR family hydrogen peroxide-inducible transcriptional activator
MGKIEGELVLGIIPTIAPYLIPRLLPVLEKLYPELRLKIEEMQTSRIVDALHTDEIDLGLLAIPLKIPKIIETPLYYEPFSILCQKNHALTKQKKAHYDQLEFEDIWLLEEGHCLRHQVLDICSPKSRKGKKRHFQFESGSLETLKNLVNSVGGYTLLPYLATDSKGSNTSLIEFERPIPSRQIGFVRRRAHHKTKMIAALGEAVLASLPEELRNMRAKNLDVLKVD